MFPMHYDSIYITPPDKEPEDFELSADTQFPNLNSRDYARQPLNHTNRMYKAWECVDSSVLGGGGDNSTGNVVICCNKNSGRDFKSSAWGFALFSILEAAEKGDTNPTKELNAVFKLQCDSLITHMMYVSPSSFILALNNGLLQLWSTYISNTPVDQDHYCLFRTDERPQEGRLVSALGQCVSDRAVIYTGSKNGTLKIWQITDSNLVLEQSYRFAHMDSISGIGSMPTLASVFASCSLDKSCLLWDQRQTRPASALLEHWEVRLKELVWSQLASKEHLLYLGDEAGRILTVDKRMPRRCLHQQRYFDCPIRRINLQCDRMAVIADSNEVKVSKVTDDDGGQDHEMLYTGSSSQHILRDCVWLQQDLLATVGFAGKLDFHRLGLDKSSA